MLCNVCQNIFKGPLGTLVNGYYSRDHHQTMVELRQSAFDGCFVCDRVWKAVLDAQNRVLETHPTADRARLSDVSQLYGCILKLEGGYLRNPQLEFGITLPAEFVMDPSDFMEYEIFELRPTREFSGFLTKNVFSNSTGSEEALALAIKWLQRCVSGHLGCRRQFDRRNLPTRLLKLESPISGHMRLFNTSIESPQGPYMTLSHCWGSAKFLNLTKDTSQLLYDGVQQNSLPRTFRDAIRVAIKLGVEYFWIDSLCIMQDSIEDWRYESSKMGDVYQGSLCNISATSADDSSKGCFRERQPRSIEPCVVQSEWTDMHNEEYHIYLQNFWYEDLKPYPLLRRGWVLQERTLPARVLHFGPQQLFWECHELDANETYQEGFIPSKFPEFYGFKRDYPLNLKRLDVSLSGIRDPQITFTQMNDFWAKMIAMYTQCNITMMRDKLVAISGIAREMHKLSGDTYLAGLWQHDLLSQLLWDRGREPFKHCLRPKQYRAPSWSWASVDGPLDLPTYKIPLQGTLRKPKDFLVSVVDVEVNSLNDDPFGEILNGCLRLRGPLITIELIPQDGKEQHESLRDLCFNGTKLRTNAWLFMDVEEAFGPSMHFMPFLYPDLDENGWEKAKGLLLQPTGKAKGQFTRCGTLTLYENDAITAGAPNWIDIQNHEWLEYESFDSVKGYTISIV